MMSSSPAGLPGTVAAAIQRQVGSGSCRHSDPALNPKPMRNIDMESSKTVHPAGKATAPRTVKKRGAISCVTIERTARGAYVSAEHFDVALEDYGDGNITGMRLAAEFMAAIKMRAPLDSLQVIVDACKAFDDGHPFRDPSRRGAAVGFLRTLEGLLVMVARAGAHEPYIAYQIERGTEWRRKEAQAKKDEKANFVRRMEIAKAAKAQARRAITQIASR